jgi:hypothetical protein
MRNAPTAFDGKKRSFYFCSHYCRYRWWKISRREGDYEFGETAFLDKEDKARCHRCNTLIVLALKDDNICGYQVVHKETDRHPHEMMNFNASEINIYPLGMLKKWISEQKDRGAWRLLPVFESDIDITDIPIFHD